MKCKHTWEFISYENDYFKFKCTKCGLVVNKLTGEFPDA